MTWGLPTGLFVQIHVALSLIGLLAGLVVVVAMSRGTLPKGWSVVALVALILTDVTGFPLAPFGMDPARFIGIISLALLAMAGVACYVGHLDGPWRWLFMIGAVTATYLDALVTVVQSFQKIPVVRALAPTQTELPFIVVQIVVLAFFVGAIIKMASGFKTERR